MKVGAEDTLPSVLWPFAIDAISAAVNLCGSEAVEASLISKLETFARIILARRSSSGGRNARGDGNHGWIADEPASAQGLVGKRQRQEKKGNGGSKVHGEVIENGVVGGI